MKHWTVITIECKDCLKKSVFLYNAEQNWGDCDVTALELAINAVQGKGYLRIRHGLSFLGHLVFAFRKR